MNESQFEYERSENKKCFLTERILKNFISNKRKAVLSAEKVWNNRLYFYYNFLIRFSKEKTDILADGLEYPFFCMRLKH